MAITIENIISRRTLETAATIQYTATGVTTVIDKMTVTNVSGSNTFINIYLPNPGSNPDASNLVLSNRTLGANETYSCPELVGQVILSGGTIVTQVGSVNALTMSASGSEIA